MNFYGYNVGIEPRVFTTSKKKAKKVTSLLESIGKTTLKSPVFNSTNVLFFSFITSLQKYTNNKVNEEKLKNLIYQCARIITNFRTNLFKKYNDTPNIMIDKDDILFLFSIFQEFQMLTIELKNYKNKGIIPFIFGKIDLSREYFLLDNGMNTLIDLYNSNQFTLTSFLRIFILIKNPLIRIIQILTKKVFDDL